MYSRDWCQILVFGMSYGRTRAMEGAGLECRAAGVAGFLLLFYVSDAVTITRTLPNTYRSMDVLSCRPKARSAQCKSLKQSS